MPLPSVTVLVALLCLFQISSMYGLPEIQENS